MLRKNPLDKEEGVVLYGHKALTSSSSGRTGACGAKQRRGEKKVEGDGAARGLESDEAPTPYAARAGSPRNWDSAR